MSFKYRDSPLYFRTAREAAQIEREGDYRRASKVWNKAARHSRNSLNIEWAENRSDFCLKQLERNNENTRGRNRKKFSQ
ncbi:ANR family transcriptional regulator [Xenorhabdus sp. DI]|uniref:ANR family transcriptional regulator n=1 Tax=Xenorhabdus doucetiae TaxID=351671 RepID=UPI0019A46C9C|nr:MULTISPECIES: ANR family transcriptional regulator [unclassified Xenorhabdus]MBD2786556.1 ANR family transcriptional regulator [Xenorhabdus sp. 3]MBD2790306.1 ANR family transcriptional regulator [Xenorhabdus sp. DI]